MAVNDHAVFDPIDFQFRTSEEEVTIRFSDQDNLELEFEFEDFEASQLGLTFEQPKVRTCQCNCIFCFVHQQPKGMRRSLYVKDEDYRLSFTHGNFVTLANTSDKELKRIAAQRLSPLYVSVHTTDDDLRRRMLRNRKLEPILSRLKFLAENNITLHTQVVLCPGINDGDNLEETIVDLANLHPGVSSLAVVPVGLTKYRERLSPLDRYTPQLAEKVLAQVDDFQRSFLDRLGTRFIWAADEFYVLADRSFPRRCEYEEMPQFENGVGMVREAITMFNRRRAQLKNVKSRKSVTFMTGRSAISSLVSHVHKYVREEVGLALDILPVDNRFWGKGVTVSGLLTGQDLLREAKAVQKKCDTIVLPPNCLNEDDLFLDDLTLRQFRECLDRPVLVGQYDIAATVKEAFS